MNPLYAFVAERAGWRCEYCQAPEEVFNFPFEVEHILPKSRGGSDEPDNLALACHACNRFKSDFATGVDPTDQAEVLLFNPRRDLWMEHFRLETEPAVIVGRTPTGRATVSRLQMNRYHHMAARRHWLELGILRPPHEET